ncbi:hypothetical protein QYF36_011902 [Acer negundo]|nr:hypothetical protein QYF36_011902 [Acer negundo]
MKEDGGHHRTSRSEEDWNSPATTTSSGDAGSGSIGDHPPEFSSAYTLCSLSLILAASMMVLPLVLPPLPLPSLMLLSHRTDWTIGDGDWMMAMDDWQVEPDHTGGLEQEPYELQLELIRLRRTDPPSP